MGQTDGQTDGRTAVSFNASYSGGIIIIVKLLLCVLYKLGARFTKYLTIILRLSYDNAKVTIDLRGRRVYNTSIEERRDFFSSTIPLQNREIV